MNQNIVKKSPERERERVVNSSLAVPTNKNMNRTLKLFGRFFIFTLAITIFSLALFTFSNTQVYAEGSFVFTNHLELGVVGNDVKELQTLLNSKGYNVGIPDGKFGATTKEQVILFQKANGLTPDGIIGQGVRAFLNGTSTSIIPTPKTTTTPKITTTTTPSITPVSLDRTLKLTIPRIKGDDVKALQTFLNNSGYNCGIADGFFGPMTEAQVKLFQIANNLTPDGKAGKNTLAVISQSPISNFKNNQTLISGCTSSLGFSTTTGVSCANTSIVSTTPGCTPGALFNTVTGQTCAKITLPTGCTSSLGFSPTSGVSCSTGLPTTSTLLPVVSGGSSGGGGSSSHGPISINKATISGITIPSFGASPIANIDEETQYTATISWSPADNTFARNVAYTATVILTPKSGYTLDGIPANFFTVAGAVATNSISSGVITAVFPATPLKQLTISNPTITTSKVYNGNLAAQVTTGTLSGIVGAEDVTVTAVATYDTKNAGTSKTITVVYTLGGVDAGNYIKPSDYAVSTGVITQIQLTASNPNLTTSKPYDRTTQAYISGGDLIGKVTDDNVYVNLGANYDSVNIGSNKTITVVYYLVGDDAVNYIKPVNYIVYSGVITTKQLTITHDPETKMYDGGNTDTTTGTVTGVAGNEDVNVIGIATYSSVDLGTDIPITVVYTLSGASAANYIKPEGYSSTGDIVPGIINVAAIAGVTAPASGAIPVATIADTTQYTATIAWSPTDDTFVLGVAYTATITLTPKYGYTLTGIPANFFKVNRAVSTNAANSGVITAVFPNTVIVLVLGDSYQGGKIAYLLQPGDVGYNEDLQQGFIITESDISTSAKWGCQGGGRTIWS